MPSSMDDLISELGTKALTLYDAKAALVGILHAANNTEEENGDGCQECGDHAYGLLWDRICDEVQQIGNTRPTSQIDAIESGPVESDLRQAVAACIRMIRVLADPHFNSNDQRKEALSLVARIEAGEPINETIHHYNERLNELELPPNGDDYNTILDFLDGAPYREPLPAEER